MSAETNIFIIWQNGRYLEQQIIADISTKFELQQVFELSWPMRDFHYNLAKFYGKSLPKGCRKEKECGCGDFLVVVVQDNQPHYEGGKNKNMKDAKALYRQMYGGQNFIHCSDTQQEGLDNLAYLTGLKPEDVAAKYGKYNGTYTKLAHQPHAEARKLSDKLWEALINFYRRLFRAK